MVTYKSYKELVNNKLKRGDRIIFSYNGETVEYAVHNTFLNDIDRGNNSKIFNLLGINSRRYEISSRAYGYTANQGEWPEFDEYDYGAAKNLILELFKLTGQGTITNWRDII